MGISRSWALLLFANALFVPDTLCIGSEQIGQQRPNILFVYTDDQASSAVGILGNDEIHTPNLDRLFSEGATLRNAMVVTPVCSPARATLLTSRYGSELEITDWIHPTKEPELGLNLEVSTWVELLQDAGYRTGLVGKWHLGFFDCFHPRIFGYEHFFGFRAGGNHVVNPRLESNDGAVRKYQGLTVDLLTDESLAFMEQHKKEPFCLSVHYRAPHSAWLPVAPEDWAPYENLDPKLPDPDWPNLDTKRVKKWTREYYASVTSVDRSVGRLLTKLKELGLEQKTVVIFTSDHGYNCGHNGTWYKGNAQWMLEELPEQEWAHIPPKQRPNLFDQSLRVPTAIRWPGVTEPGMVVDQVVTNLDWFPTLLKMAGVEMPVALANQTRGRDFTALLKNEVVEWDNEAYFEYDMHHGAQAHMRAWRTPDWKLMIDLKNPGRRELYNLKDDPTEKNNLSSAENLEIRAVMKRLEAKIYGRMGELDGALAP